MPHGKSKAKDKGKKILKRYGVAGRTPGGMLGRTRRPRPSATKSKSRRK